MTFIIFLGGSGGLFVVIFILILLGNFSSQFCNDVRLFLENNVLTITLVTTGITLGLSALIGGLQRKLSAFFAYIPLILQLFLCIFYGMYSVVTLTPDSFFLTLFGLLIYVGTFIVDVFICAATVSFSLSTRRSWPVALAGLALCSFIPIFF